MTLDVFFFFFFQAEDGIRDLTVTGVQTCALPISHRTGALRAGVHGAPTTQARGRSCAAALFADGTRRRLSPRRRVSPGAPSASVPVAAEVASQPEAVECRRAEPPAAAVVEASREAAQDERTCTTTAPSHEPRGSGYPSHTCTACRRRCSAAAPTRSRPRRGRRRRPSHREDRYPHPQRRR